MLPRYQDTDFVTPRFLYLRCWCWGRGGWGVTEGGRTLAPRPPRLRHHSRPQLPSLCDQFIVLQAQYEYRLRCQLLYRICSIIMIWCILCSTLLEKLHQAGRKWGTAIATHNFSFNINLEHLTHIDPFIDVASVCLVIAVVSNIRVTRKYSKLPRDWSGSNSPGEGGSLYYKWDLHLEGG